MEKSIIHLSEVDSTNKYLKNLIKDGACAGTVVLADCQTNGRGRLGRSFFSPRNGLYMSVLICPDNDFNPLLVTAAAGVAVVRAVYDLTGEKCGIKWVNDIIFSGKKLCGILAEGVFDAEKGILSHIVLGIGLNISDPEGGFDSEIKDIACSLFGEKAHNFGFSLILCNKICDELFAILENPDKGEFLEDYMEFSVLKDKEIFYLQNGEKHFCKVLGFDDNAGLIVLEDGKQKVITSGEVTVREIK